MLNGKTVLVTGATGLIGSRLVDALMQMDNVRVIALSRSESNLRTVFRPYLEQDNFQYLAQDVSAPIKVKENIDIIFHAAGPIGEAVIREHPLSVIEPNVVGTRNCLDYLCRQADKTGKIGQAVIFSSATVYGDPSPKTRVTETDTQQSDALDTPLAPYSQSKRMAETLARAYLKERGVDTRIVRFSYVYGYSRIRPQTAFFDFIQQALDGKDIMLNNAGLPRRDNIYVDDAVIGMLTALEKGEAGHAYNVSSDKDKDNFAAIDEMAMEIANVVNEKGLAGKEIHVHYQSGDVNTERKPGLLLAHDRLSSLGWSIKYSLRQGIEQTVRALYCERNTSDDERRSY